MIVVYPHDVSWRDAWHEGVAEGTVGALVRFPLLLKRVDVQRVLRQHVLHVVEEGPED